MRAMGVLGVLGVLTLAVVVAACQTGPKSSPGEPSPGEPSPGEAAPTGPAEPLYGSQDRPVTPRWQSESAELVFMSSESGSADIYIAQGLFGTWTNLTDDPAADNWPEWSPSGDRIVFQSNRSGNLDVWVMDADGSNLAQLTSDPGPDYLPSWHPDGQQIVFTSWRQLPDDEMRAPHLYVMPVEGGAEAQRVSGPLGASAGARFSADGTTIVYARLAEGRSVVDIHLADADGGNERRLTDADVDEGAPSISPDGSRVAFHAAAPGDTSEILVVSIDGTGRRTIVSGGRAWYPRWSPDGHWLIYTAMVGEGELGDLDVWAVSAEGGEPVWIVGGPGREAEGCWRP